MAFLFAVSITLKISLSPRFLSLVFVFQNILNLNERALWSDHHHPVLCVYAHGQVFQRWRCNDRFWLTLLWRHPVGNMGAAAAQTWARLRKVSGCSSSSSWAKQIAYLTASSKGRFLFCCTHFCHFSVSWRFFVCPGRQKCVSRDTVVTAVQSFLYTCQPFFNHLEHLTRSTVSQSNPLPAESCTRVNFHSFIAFLDKHLHLEKTFCAYLCYLHLIIKFFDNPK